MDPDSDSPISRVERAFWTVWYYVAGAVNRFLRPEPTNITSNDPNSFQESAVNSEPADSGHTEGETSRGEVNEEQTLVPASLLSTSRAIVAWELCSTDINLGPDEEHTQCKTQLSGGSESKASEEGEGMREEQFSQTGNDDAGLIIPKYTRAKKDEEEEHIHQKLYIHGQVESPENDKYEEHVKMESLNLTDDVMSEDMEGSRRRTGDEEETQRTVTMDDPEKMNEIILEIQVKEEDNKIHVHHEDEQELEVEDTVTNVCTITDFDLKEENNMHREEATVQMNDADTAVMHEENSDGVLQLASENENKSDEGGKQPEKQVSVCEELSEIDIDVKGDTDQQHLMAHTSESYKVEEEQEKENESILDEEQGEEENTNEAADNQTIDEEPEQEEDIKAVTEDSQDILTEHVSCSKDVVQNANTEMHTAEFTNEEQEDVAKETEVQTKTREKDDVGEVTDEKTYVTTTEVSVNEIIFDKDRVEEESLSSEVDNKERYMEIACTTTSVTVKPEAETGQEISGELKNIPLRMCEGRVAVSQELNSPTCEETQEGVPEYNNEPGLDENTTQSFLEVGNCEEIQTTQLPEEVESKERESLQNLGCGTGADYLLVREHREEEQESTEHKEHTGILHLTDSGLPQETDKPFVAQVIQESGLLFEEEEGKLLVHSMKTEIEHSDEEFKTHVGLVDESNETTTELQDVTEELVVEFEIDEGICDSSGAAGHELSTEAVAAGEVVGLTDETTKFLDAEVEKMTDTSLFQESVDMINSDQKCNMTTSLLEDITKSGFLKESIETEPEILEHCTVEMQDAVIHREETNYGLEQKTMNKNDLQLVEIAAEPIKETDKNQSVSELDEAFEISNEEMSTDTGAADELRTPEFKSKDLLSAEEMRQNVTELERSYAEETSSSISGQQDVIDEEILDLWIQAALPEDTDDMKQEEPEPGQQMDTKIEPSNEEQAEILSVQTETETEKEQLVESNSGESELVGDTEISLLTVESGFLGQSLSEWDAQNSETQPQKSSESFQDIHDMLASISESADISELSTQQSKSESGDRSMEESADIGQSDLKDHPDSGVTSLEVRHQNQESDKSQEKTNESTENETICQKDSDADIIDLAIKTDWKYTEEVDVMSPTSVSTEKVEDEALEVTASDSPDEIKHTESGRSGSEVLSEIVLTESGLQEDTWTESGMLFKLHSLEEPQPRESEDLQESLPELNRTEMLEQPTTKFAGLVEVDGSLLDFTAQRSRIALKNPRVRPPKDPRSLLHMPSAEPTPSSRLPVKVPAGVPLVGLGIGIKLPGLGAGFPVLKKTQHVVREDNSPETTKEAETKPEDKSDTPKQDEAQHKPKWMPPKHPGFGNPLMSELKTKLKKTTKE